MRLAVLASKNWLSVMVFLSPQFELSLRVKPGLIWYNTSSLNLETLEE